MSLVLTNAGEKLEITAGVAIPFVVHYADYVGATPVFTPGVVGGDTINGTKDLLAAPGSGQRVVRTISVHNDSGGADIVTVQLDDGGTNYTIVTAILSDDFALYYDEDGWKVLNSSGAVLTTTSVQPVHALLGVYHSDTTADAPTRGSMITGNAVPAWDELVHPGTAYHLQTDANDIVWAQDITMANGAWQGIGAALERLVFSTAGYISVVDAKLGVNIAPPSYRLDVRDDIAAPIGFFFNDGNNDNRSGIMIQCGADTNPTASLILLRDGNATNIGNILGDGAGGVTYWSASDERLKNILGPIDQDLAMKALVEVNPIQYVGKGLTAQTGHKNFGFVAQDIYKHLPGVATYDEEEDMYGLSYERLVPVLWAQIKALLNRIEQLEAR